MQPSDRKRFAACLLGCAELYGKEVSDAAVKLWWEALKVHDIGAVEAAFARHIRSSDAAGSFMPKPADVIRMIEGTSLDASMVAWSKFERAVRQIGPYQSVVFDDPLIHKVVAQMGGWVAFAHITDKDWPFTGNEFRTRYKGLKSRGDASGFPARLPGLTEADCARCGAVLPPPVMIGDPELAGAVLAAGVVMAPALFHRIGDLTALPP